MKTLPYIAGVLIFGATAALAGVGVPPLPNGNQAMIDQTWALGVAAGQNASYEYGLAAAGSNQAGSTQLASGYTLMEIDSGTGGVALPPAIQGTVISIYNASGATLTVYPSIANNGLTAAQDTINNGTSFGSFTNHTAHYFFSPKNGVWAAI